MNNKICIIGGGNLGLSILNGLIRSKQFENSNLSITKRNHSELFHLSEIGINVSNNNQKAIKNAEIILIAVKPYDVEKVLLEIGEHLQKNQLIVSLATGITFEEIKKHVNSDISIYRAMPNTATDINASMTCVASNKQELENDKKVADFFDLIGKTIFIKEELMEAATVLGACGIAYVLRFIRSMVQGGIQIGFDAKTATDIVNQVVLGASSLLIERKTHPEQEIDKVTTPKGCTISGLNEMEHNGFSSSLIKGITTSYFDIKK